MFHRTTCVLCILIASVSCGAPESRDDVSPARSGPSENTPATADGGTSSGDASGAAMSAKHTGSRDGTSTSESEPSRNGTSGSGTSGNGTSGATESSSGDSTAADSSSGESSSGESGSGESGSGESGSGDDSSGDSGSSSAETLMADLAKAVASGDLAQIQSYLDPKMADTLRQSVGEYLVAGQGLREMLDAAATKFGGAEALAKALGPTQALLDAVQGIDPARMAREGALEKNGERAVSSLSRATQIGPVQLRAPQAEMVQRGGRWFLSPQNMIGSKAPMDIGSLTPVMRGFTSQANGLVKGSNSLDQFRGGVVPLATKQLQPMIGGGGARMQPPMPGGGGMPKPGGGGGPRPGGGPKPGGGGGPRGPR